MKETSEKVQRLAQRIAAIKKEKQEQMERSKPEAFSAQATQVVIELVSGVIVGSSIGYILDEIFDFRHICLLIFTIFGGMAGFINMARYLKGIKEEQEGNKRG